jgi:hypothetical protein
LRAIRENREELEKERDRLRCVLEASKVALGSGGAVSDEALPKRIEGIGAGLLKGADRIKALEHAFVRILVPSAICPGRRAHRTTG